jgi:hypothetical protein
MNRNYKIKQISVPEFNDKEGKTGININLEVVSIEKLKAIVNTPDGGTLTTEGLYIVCFENMPNKEKKLRVFNADSDLITVTKYEKYVKNNEFRRDHSANRRKNRKNRNDNNSKLG